MKGFLVVIISIIVYFVIQFSGSEEKGIFGNLSSSENKISKNTTLNNMFKQRERTTRSEEHRRQAEKNWMEKYFNIHF